MPDQDELARRRERMAAKLSKANELAKPASRSLASIDQIKAGKEQNDQRRKSSRVAKVQPGLPGNVFGPMDPKEFYAFCHVTLHYEDMMPQPHDEMCEFVADLFPDLSFKGTDANFGLVMVPRSCFKSVIFSVGLPLYLLWKNPNGRGLLSGHRHDASKEQLRTIKWNIEHNEDFIELCGDWKPKFKEQKYAEDAIIIVGRTEALRDPSIDTCGVDRSKVGAHPDWIICDDLHSEMNVATALMRTKVLDHIIAMYPMLQPGGTMLVIGTRWHYADAYGKLLAMDDEAELKGLPRKYKTLIRSCYTYNEKGEVDGLYFPTRLNEKFLTTQLYSVGKTKFSLWYLNKPIADDDKLFPRDSLNISKLTYFFDEEQGLPTIEYNGEYFPVGVGLTWDPAGIRPSDKSDFHGVSVVGCDPFNRWFIPCAEAIKGKPDYVLSRVAAIVTRYSPDYIVIESVGQSGVWGYLFQEYCERQGIHCPPILFYTPPSREAKNERIETLQPKVVAHEIIIDRKCRELIDQFDSFPQLDNDDLLDSVQMHRDYARPADPASLDVLVDYTAIEHGHMKTVSGEDPRRAIGSYAGVHSSNWSSLVRE